MLYCFIVYFWFQYAIDVDIKCNNRFLHLLAKLMKATITLHNTHNNGLQVSSKQFSLQPIYKIERVEGIK